MVEYENSNSITVNGITITNKSDAKDMTCEEGKGNDGKIKTDGKVQFAEKYFPDLKAAPATDDLGHPATKWMWKKDKIGTYGKKADETYTLTDTYAIGENAKYASLQAVLRDEDFTDNDDLVLSTKINDEVVKTKVYVNGVKVDADSTAVQNALKNAAKGGTTVELYYNDDDKDVVDHVTILNYSIEQIKDVSTKLTKDQKDDGATSKIKVGSKWYLDNDVAGFDSKTYVEDAYLLYILKADKTEMIASQIAEEITGKATATKGDDKATIGGTQYKYVEGVEINVDDEGSFYLSVAGQIAEVDTTSNSDNYAFVYKIDKDTGVNSDGVNATTYTAYYVAADGTKASAVVDIDEVTEKETEDLEREAGVYYADTKVLVKAKQVIAFSINGDKELVYETAKDTISGLKAAGAISKSSARGTDSDTQFIFTWAKSSTQKVATKTGYKNVNIDGSTQYITVKDKDSKDILYVFVAGENDSVSSDTKYAVALDGTATKTKNGDDTIYTYDVVIDGEETTLSSKNTKLSLEKGEAFSYELDGEYVDTKSVSELEYNRVKAGTKNYVTVEVDGEEKQFNLDDDVKAIYTVTLEYKTEAAYNEAIKTATLGLADLDSVSASEGADVDSKSWVAYKVDGSDLAVLFVVDFVY